MSALRQPDSSQSYLQENHAEFVEFPFIDEDRVPVRVYRKSELALMYGLSLPTIRGYINKHLAKFEAIGYDRDMRKLTPKMVELFFELVGRP
ncbi:MAG: hypothetical protein V4543_00655 [Bacteroidota bacterium]